MQPKRIAFLKSGIKNCGGLEKYTLRLARIFSSAGHDVSLLTTDCNPEAFEGENFKVVNLGTRSKFSLWHLLRFDARCKKYIANNRFDSVFGMDRNFCLQTHYRAGNGVHAAYLDRRKKLASVCKKFSFDLNPLHKMILRMEKATFESPCLQTLFTNSSMVKEEILRYYSVAPETIEVIHNGVEWHELALPFHEGLAVRENLIKQLGLSPKRFQFLFVGNDYRRKGLDLVLEALACLTDRNFELSVVGKDRNPELYVEKAKALGLQNHVRFFGPIKEIKTLYSASDALIIASMYDPFANVTVEALAMGVYVISSSANGGSEVLTDDTLGTVFDDLHNPEQLAACLQRAMKRPKTPLEALRIRNSVSHLDFSVQLNSIVKKVF